MCYHVRMTPSEKRRRQKPAVKARMAEYQRTYRERRAAYRAAYAKHPAVKARRNAMARKRRAAEREFSRQIQALALERRAARLAALDAFMAALPPPDPDPTAPMP